MMTDVVIFFQGWTVDNWGQEFGKLHYGIAQVYL